MSPRRYLAWCALVTGLLLPACQRSDREVSEPPSPPAASRAPASAPAPAPASAWKSLFDGKSLAGWQTADFFGAGQIEVKDRAIRLPRGKPMAGITYTRGDFPTMDYELALEAQKIDGNDFFCTTTFPVGDAFCSLVVGGWGGKLVGLSSIDFMDASMNETQTDREFKPGQWYHVRLRVSAKRIEAWIDGDQVVDLDTTDRGISIRIECEPCKPFGIATYDTIGAVRAIQVRPLTAAEKKGLAETKPQEKK